MHGFNQTGAKTKTVSDTAQFVLSVTVTSKYPPGKLVAVGNVDIRWFKL